jgi:hypothetical protein
MMGVDTFIFESRALLHNSKMKKSKVIGVLWTCCLWLLLRPPRAVAHATKRNSAFEKEKYFSKAYSS